MSKIDNKAVTKAMLAVGLESSRGDELDHGDMGRLQSYAFFKGFSPQAFHEGMANDRDNTLITLFPGLGSPELMAAEAKEAADKEAAEAQAAQEAADKEAAEAQAAQTEADAADALAGEEEAPQEDAPSVHRKKSRK